MIESENLIRFIENLEGAAQWVIQFWDSIKKFPDLRFKIDFVLIHQLLWKYWYVVLSVFFFWPVWVNLIIAFATASGWTFWLLTSIMLGCLQVVYASYQFLCITVDIFGLSVLKTFAMLRGQILQLSVMSGLMKGRKKSRRREWREFLRNAKDYADFKQLPIEEPKQDIQPLNGLAKPHALLTDVRAMARNIGNFLRASGEKCFAEAIKQPQNPEVSDSLITPATPLSKYLRKSQSCMNFSPASIPQIPKNTFCRDDDDDETTEDDLSRGTSPVTLNNGSMTPPATLRRKHSRQFSQSHSLSATDLLTISPKTSRDEADTMNPHSLEHYLFIKSIEKELGMAGGLLVATTDRLHEARMQAINGGDTSPLKFLLAGVVKRNHLSVDDILTENARSIAECGRHHYSEEARQVVLDFIEEVEDCLDFLAQSKATTSLLNRSSLFPQCLMGHSTSSTSLNQNVTAESAELTDRLKLVTKMKLNTGCTALMLSGGGAQAMYHVGTIRALLQSKVWGDIPVISGTSGGSISAAMCAMKTEEELLRDVCVANVSTDFLCTGQMKKENIRWFPTLWEMGRNWLKSRLLVDSKEFKRCCDFYFEDVTFEEAFLRTGKHVCITVSASRSGAGGAQRLLLNHISTPHVTLSSAVAASCALPGVMKPAKLMAKDGNGNQVVFEVDGVEWIDGSVQADLPFKRISTLFNVSNFIVCQVNFHVVPFLNKDYHPSTKSLYWQLFQILEWDVRSRALNLARLGLFPRIFGQDVSKVFKQKYHGNITLVPKFTMKHVFGMQVLSNPTAEDMELYITNGQKSAWPYIESIRTILRLEKAIDRCLDLLKERFHQLPQDLQSKFDVDSVSSSAVGHHTSYGANNSRQQNLLKVKVSSLEAENAMLRKKIYMLETSSSKQNK